MDKQIFQPEGNYTDKYNYKNPIARYLISNFLRSIEGMLRKIEFSTIYEPGCGEGYVSKFLSELYPAVNIFSSDISEKIITQAKAFCTAPNVHFSVESIYDPDHEASSFDIVIACEVLEHLEEPEKALLKLIEISKRYLLLSVPNEPIWRFCNVARGKYLKDFGNTPGHIQHWSGRSFCRFTGKMCDILAIKTPFPWTMLLCEKRR